MEATTLSAVDANSQLYVNYGELDVALPLQTLINEKTLPDLGISAEDFWSGLTTLLATFSERNIQLLVKRDAFQAKLDQWCQQFSAKATSPTEMQAFLTEIGYIEPVPEPFTITTSGVDREIALVAGPQLVVPVSNARYALNAANARWGSLYDALYGTDVIPEKNGAEQASCYNPIRGEAVVAYALGFLDQAIPLQDASHVDVSEYRLNDLEHNRCSFAAQLKNGQKASLVDEASFIGYQGSITKPTALLFQHNQLHIELQIDHEHPIGKAHPAGLKDIVLESAVTTIQDCEDSVAATDASEKAQVYANWLGLMRGDLSASLNKGGQTLERRLSPDRIYHSVHGDPLVLPGRSLLLVRNVGLLMQTDSVLYQGKPIPEGILDAWVTATMAIYDLKGISAYQNSAEGSVYIVKPKMHGPEEVAFSCDLFDEIERLLGLPAKTLKIGIMDEERRTTLNLPACIKAAAQRVIFINTGFLDRTGDEIHSSMKLGAMVPKKQMKAQPWISAYESWNVQCGLAAGFYQKAQIGKGMWAIPDKMHDMLEQKIAHPKAGAGCAWVPSPTAATLHAMHYHRVNVAEVQAQLLASPPVNFLDLLRVPVSTGETLSEAARQEELENNIQGILGYVVRWVDQGVGCSKVPDIHNVGLMEDRATLRISSQLIANWLYHGWVSESQVRQTMQKMAKVVDAQNLDDPGYLPMAQDYDNNIAFQAAHDLIFTGINLPNGYTEPVLHKARRKVRENNHH